MSTGLRRAWPLFWLPALALGACASEPAAPSLTSPDDKALYSIGFQLAKRLEVFDIQPDELPLVMAGLDDALSGREPQVATDEAGSLRDFVERRRDRQAQAERAAAEPWIAEMAAVEGAETTESGMVLRVLETGEGPTPKAGDKVKVHYHGTLRDGTVFDSSVQRGQPAVFPLAGIIPCWVEALTRVPVGSKIDIVCPDDIAYGSRGAGANIAPGAALRFEVELLEIVPDPAEAPPAEAP